MSEELLERFIQIRSENSKYSLEVIKLRNEIEKLETKIKLLNDIVGDKENSIEQLEKQNALMREALEFYANKNTWQSVYVGYGDKSQIKGFDLEDLSFDDRPDEYGGKRAREVLEKINKGGVSELLD